MPQDKIFVKQHPRGSHVELSATINDVDLRLVKLADNCCLNLIPSFSSAHPIGKCVKYDKKKKELIDVPYPEIVSTYNNFMGGVDLMDSKITLYRIHIRSKKYYHRLFSIF